MKNYKIILKSVAEFLLIGVILLYVTSAFHEYAHLKVLHILGGDGYIISPMETIITVSSSNDTLVAFSGGLVTAGVLIIAFVLALLHEYFEFAMASFTHALIQVGYGVFEGFNWQLPAEEFVLPGRIVALSALALGLIISIYVLYVLVWQE